MNRDKAIEIAADAIPRSETIPWERWAASVVAGADALLAAMEPKCVCDEAALLSCPKHGIASQQPVAPPLTSLFANQLALNDEITRRARGMADVNAKPAEPACCAATESRVVRELAEHFDSIEWLASARIVRCGDWRAKAER